MTVGAGPLEVLIICTGNICRSPQAAALLRTALDADDGPIGAAVRITGAGTHAHIGAPMDAAAAELAEYYGAADTSHSGRQLTADLVRASDLVLCMSREHRRAAVQKVPASSRRVFLLSEFVDLVEDLTHGAPVAAGAGGTAWQPCAELLDTAVPERLRAGIDAAAARRGLAPHPDGTPLEIIDPYRRDPEVYRESAAQIHQAVQQLHEGLRRLVQAAPQ